MASISNLIPNYMLFVVSQSPSVTMRVVSPMVPPPDIEAEKYGNFFERSFERAVREEIPKIHQLEACCQIETPQLPVPPGLTYNVPPPNSAPSRPWHPTFSPVPNSNMTYSSGCAGNLPVPTLLSNPVSPKMAEDTIPSASSQYPNADPFFSSAYLGEGTASMPEYDIRGAGKFFLSLPQGMECDSIERRMRSQERNRLAAMKSRQRKKKEWERLLESEKNLALENAELKREVLVLREKIALLEGQLSNKND